MLSQMTYSIVGFLRQDHAGLCSFERGLARCDYFRARAGIDVGELGLGHDLGG
jgi:hypothetical protein